MNYMHRRIPFTVRAGREYKMQNAKGKKTLQVSPAFCLFSFLSVLMKCSLYSQPFCVHLLQQNMWDYPCMAFVRSLNQIFKYATFLVGA